MVVGLSIIAIIIIMVIADHKSLHKHDYYLHHESRDIDQCVEYRDYKCSKCGKIKRVYPWR